MPRRYTVEGQAADRYVGARRERQLPVSVGPNGYFRRFGFGAADAGAKPEITPCYDTANGDVYVTIANAGTGALTVTVTDVA